MTGRALGDRMVDLSLKAIELIDRNLYGVNLRCALVGDGFRDGAMCWPSRARPRRPMLRNAWPAIPGATTVYVDLLAVLVLDGQVLASWSDLDRFKVMGWTS